MVHMRLYSFNCTIFLVTHNCKSDIKYNVFQIAWDQRQHAVSPDHLQMSDLLLHRPRQDQVRPPDRPLQGQDLAPPRQDRPLHVPQVPLRGPGQVQPHPTLRHQTRPRPGIP